MYTEYVHGMYKYSGTQYSNQILIHPQIKIKRNQKKSNHKWAGQVSPAGITSGRDRSLTGRHHRRWVGQVSHRQESSQVGGAGLSQAGVTAGGWGRSLTGRHHRRWVGQVFHRQASSQVGRAGLSQAGSSANFDNPARCVTYIYIYIQFWYDSTFSA